MIAVRWAKQRRYVRRRKHESWITFHGQDGADFADGFGSLQLLNEYRLPAGGGIPAPPRRDAEIVTYVREGALACVDSLGRSGVVQAGEFRLMTGGRKLRHSEVNASRTETAHVFHTSLRPREADLDYSQEQVRFSTAQRRGVLCTVASPDARRGSLRIHQDAVIYSALLDPGQHSVHELAHRRGAWLQVVEGELRLGDHILTTGDGAGITAERAVSITAREATEILLFDLGEDAPR